MLVSVKQSMLPSGRLFENFENGAVSENFKNNL